MRTRVIATVPATLVLSVIFATLLVGLARIETFVEPLRVRPGVAAPVTLRLAPARLHALHDAETDGEITALHLRVARGDVVTDPLEATVVRTYEDARRPPRLDEMVGLFFVYFIVALLSASWLRTLSPGRGALLRTQIGLLTIIFVLCAGAKVYFLATDFGSAAVPMAAIPLWTRVYLDRRTAFMVSAAAAGLLSSLIDFDAIAATVFLAAGMTPVMVMRDRKRLGLLVPAAIVGGLAGAGTYAAARVLFLGEFDLWRELAVPQRSELVAAVASGPLSGLLASLLHPLAVRALGAVSRARLLELSDLDQPLLKRMAEDAPGSWEHARAMANLAEAAANAIRGDALLTRVGAYYHDLGKTIQPKFFVENLARGETSPHVGLDPDVSADAIMAHVVEGTDILRRGGIPEPVVEFSYTHHGTSVIEYFWHKCLEQGNPKGRSEAFFRYPGMRPRTKETAILMLVDSIEAASRTIDPPDREKFDEMVQRIVFVKLKQGQLDESGLTLADLRTMSTQLVDTLCNVHHTRIRYPWQERKDKGQAQLPIPGAKTEDEIVKERAADPATSDAEISREVLARDVTSPSSAETTTERERPPRDEEERD